MNTVLKFLSTFDANEKKYWAGIALLFAGLCLSSLPAALIVTGAVIAAESVVTSYLAAWLNTRKR